ncbi:Uma2 family endonuclease [Archangium violaceum]|uniref:Uma2 family endonuclease n=1 Tax=Archangium violaceum TaxID=83451 RepID=UPI00193C5B58|nr:Uma2 family endonuclease [Archangium violaceum]QRK11634.1 Uma2 family endonuclease [Archangium violaceum]
MGKRPATYADLEELPPNMVGEIIAGELYASPRPAIPHAQAASRLGGVLMGPFDLGWNGPGGWLLLDEPEFHLGGDVLVPDLAGWRRERLPEAPRTTALTLAPDWACEVLSPSTEARDRAVKLPAYAREGVRHVWLVDPDVRTLEVFRLAGMNYTLLATFTEDAQVRAEPFEAIELELSALWGGA